jgi:hypothetical protein
MDESIIIGRQPDAAQGDVAGKEINVTGHGMRDVYANNVTITQGGARDINATNVTLKQGGAQEIEASTLEIRQGGALRLQADKASVIQGGVALAQTKQLQLGAGGAAAGLLTDQADIQQSLVETLIARGTVTAEQTAFGIAIAPQVKLNNSAALFVLGQHIEGDVVALFGPAAAAAFGAAFGVAAALVFLLTRRQDKTA